MKINRQSDAKPCRLAADFLLEDNACKIEKTPNVVASLSTSVALNAQKNLNTAPAE